MNKFVVYYTDETKFEGNPLKAEWMKINQTKKINKLEYFFGGLYVAMEGYSEYNHLLEYVAMGATGIEKIMLMGRTNEDTEVIVFDLKNKKFYKNFKSKYREYGNQILAGWQQGNLTTPKSIFKKVPNV